MADFVKTITNNLNIFGIDQPNKWGSMVWGRDNWGFGQNDLIVTVFKLLTNSITLTDTTTLSIGYIRTFSLSLSVSADMSDERIFDRAGYAYVFGASANAESRPLTSYNSYSSPVASFTSVSNTSTTWVRQ
jgi:hypothetical protein